MANVVTVIVAAMASQAQARVLSVFEGAYGPETAVAYDPPRGMERSQLKQWLKAGVVREAEPGRYWLDRDRMAARKAAHKRIAIWVLAGLVALILVSVVVKAAASG